ncbi:MAG: alpha/beta hydrolase [Burkholderiaceae bacterium]
MIHPDMDQLAQARAQLGNLAITGGSPAEFRKFWSAYSALLHEPCPAGIAVRDEIVPAPHGGVPIRIYRAAAASARAPVVVYLHGGGFVAGDLDSSETSAWGFADQIGAVVVSVDYRLAPEHPYPAALDDCWAVLRWLPTQAERLGIDASRLALTGESAGGNLSAALAMKARGDTGVRIGCVAAVYPYFGASLRPEEDPPSYLEFADSPSLRRESIHKYRDLYRQSQRDHADPLARPAIAAEADLRGLPPFAVLTGGMDPIRDDGRIFATRLIMAGVPTSYREARGMIHGFMRARIRGAAVQAEYDWLCSFLAAHIA